MDWIFFVALSIYMIHGGMKEENISINSLFMLLLVSLIWLAYGVLRSVGKGEELSDIFLLNSEFRNRNWVVGGGMAFSISLFVLLIFKKRSEKN